MKNFPLTPEEFARLMEAKSNNRDGGEDAHVQMDKLMCDQLEALGYKAGVDVFKDTRNIWYA